MMSAVVGRCDPSEISFHARSYERERNQAAIEALGRGAYASGFEPGCALGELTVQLARICDRVLATDVAMSAIRRARRRCAPFKNVAIQCADLALNQPKGPFDLIVLNEIGASFSSGELIRIGRALADVLTRGGELAAVHGLGPHRQALHGDAVHSLLGRHMPLEWAGSLRHDGFRIDRWVRP